VGFLAGTLPIAGWLWQTALGASMGRYVTIQQIHLGEYFVLGWLSAWYAQVDPRSPALMRRMAWLVIAISLVDECVQGLLPQRVFEWSDVSLNIAGGMAGMAIAAGGMRSWRWWQKRRMAS
jgi:hypothetical protein